MVDGLEELLMAAFEYWVDDLTDVSWGEVQAAIDRQAEVLRREGWRRDTDESSRGERLRTEQDLEYSTAAETAEVYEKTEEALRALGVREDKEPKYSSRDVSPHQAGRVWECYVCGAAVSDVAKHIDWHNELDKEKGE